MPLKSLTIAIGLILLLPAAVQGAGPELAPRLAGPADGMTVAGLGPALEWVNPDGTVQYHLQVVPSGNDGPGIDLIIGSSDGGFQIPSPPQWYGLRPA
jgi:hypothetical protein